MKIKYYILNLFFWIISSLYSDATNLTSDIWVKKFIEEHNLNSAELFKINLSPSQIDYYETLQKTIAEKIPKESKRPTLFLEILGRQTPSYAIVGGMGPLSDARIVNLVIDNLRQKGLVNLCKISLLSAPPPRSIWESATKGFSYISRLYTFVNNDHTYVYLASNSAHLYFNWIDRLGSKNLVNLTQYVADQVQIISNKPHVLIAGTTKGRKANLYGKLLANRSISYAFPSDIEQDLIEEIIQMTKIGIEPKSTLVDVLIKSIAKTKTNTLLLSCTELSIALENQQEQLKALGIIIIDSEKLFAEKICIDIQNALL